MAAGWLWHFSCRGRESGPLGSGLNDWKVIVLQELADDSPGVRTVPDLGERSQGRCIAGSGKPGE